MNSTCGCCEGTHVVGPQSVENPPGLDALAYRVGTHGTFLETMLARLTSHELPGGGRGRRPLQALTARTPDDPAIAMLDAWATVADVLTFYQERIANEGFLRTAVERRSLVEIGRLLGYELRPAISSTAYLAFTIADDPTSAKGVPIPKATRAQSLAPAGGLPASFETAEDLFARPDWNTLLPRTEQPQRIDRVRANFMPAVVLEGPVTTLAAGDLLLFEFGDIQGEQVVCRIDSVTISQDRRRTTVTPGLTIIERCLRLADLLDEQVKKAVGIEELRATAAFVGLIAGSLRAGGRGGADPGSIEVKANSDAQQITDRVTALLIADDPVRVWAGEVLRIVFISGLGDRRAAVPPPPDTKPSTDPIESALAALTVPLAKPPSIPPATSAQFARDSRTLFAAGSDLPAQLLTAQRPELAGTLHQALSNASLAVSAPLKALYGLTKHAQPFGATAPLAPKFSDSKLAGSVEWLIGGTTDDEGLSTDGDPPHTSSLVALDSLYPSAYPGSWVVVERLHIGRDFTGMVLVPRQVAGTVKLGAAAYHMAGSVTQLDLREGWLDTGDVDILDANLGFVRRATIHLGAERLTLAQETIPTDIAGKTITLDGVKDGLQSGRRLIVTGERTDVPGVKGIRSGELVMLASTEHAVDTTLPGDKVHTVLHLTTDLSYHYLRSTVRVWGNVAKATHGEIHGEVLGGGDPTQPVQTFRLSLGPLTNLPAVNRTGARDTLEVRVDGVAWHETDDLMSVLPGDRKFLVQTDDDGTTRTVFGAAAPLPSGPDNVRAVYRVGSGSGGNIEAEKITQLLTRPLGVRDVINPLAATGGADREGIASVRRSLPIQVMALDRLVGVRDYADFARARAGIGKASATRIKHSRVVHVTVTGVDDGPLLENSDLFTALRESLLSLGDPNLPLVVAVRRLRLIVLVASIRVQPDYAWPEVEPRLRASLLHAFGFERRELGEAVVLSKVIAAAQSVRGVESVDIDGTALAPEEITPAGIKALAEGLAGAPPDRLLVASAGRADDGSTLLAAELAVLSPRVPDTLVLREVPA